MFMIGVLVVLSAFFKACMDCFENENFFESIFRNLNQKFWYKRESWKYVKKILGYRFDAWHMSNSLMWLCVFGAVVIGIYQKPPVDAKWWMTLFLLAGWWNVAFNIFYHLIFRVK